MFEFTSSEKSGFFKPLTSIGCLGNRNKEESKITKRPPAINTNRIYLDKFKPKRTFRIKRI